MYLLIDDSYQSVVQTATLISFGSLWIPKEDFINIEHGIFNLRLTQNCWGEFKWTNVDKIHLPIYKSLIDLFLNTQSARFNFITQIEPSKQDLKTFHGGDMMTAKMKQIFNLVFYNYLSEKNGFCSGKTLHLIADEPFLERGEYKEKFLKSFNAPTQVPIQSAIKANSSVLNTLQLSDVLTGLVACHTCMFLYPNKIEVNAQSEELIKYLSQIVSIDPLTTGKPSNPKINNWFHRPGITWKTIKPPF